MSYRMRKLGRSFYLSALGVAIAVLSFIFRVDGAQAKNVSLVDLFAVPSAFADAPASGVGEDLEADTGSCCGSAGGSGTSDSGGSDADDAGGGEDDGSGEY